MTFLRCIDRHLYQPSTVAVSAELLVVRHSAQLDADGNPVKGFDGNLVKDKVLGYAIMEKRAGWGNEYPDPLRNGEWEYRVFTAEKTPNDPAKLTACFECHKPTADRDFVRSYDKLKAAAQKAKRGKTGASARFRTVCLSRRLPALAAPLNEMAARTELHAIDMLTLSDAQFLSGEANAIYRYRAGVIPGAGMQDDASTHIKMDGGDQ
jgi:hypothetical protein